MKIQLVPRSKHPASRFKTQSLFRREVIAGFSEVHTNAQINSVGRK